MLREMTVRNGVREERLSVDHGEKAGEEAKTDTESWPYSAIASYNTHMEEPRRGQD